MCAAFHGHAAVVRAFLAVGASPLARQQKRRGHKARTARELAESKVEFFQEAVRQAVADKKMVETALTELTNITGQKAVPTTSKKDISNFKLRKNVAIGVKVTLRKDRMYEFLERLINTSLPRIRDFKGINNKMDGRGNYTLGITEQIIFPEIDIDKVSKIFGMEISFVTNANSDEEGFALLREFGIPFKTNKK